MARDQFEYDVGDQLRDRYGRVEYVLTQKHAAPISSDTERAYAPSDADGRQQIVIQDSAHNDLAISMAKAEIRTTPYTVYVDQLAGNDANTGNSPGSAVATVAKAAALLWAAAEPGCIKFNTAAAGNHLLAQTLHLPLGTQLECFKDGAVTFLRNFDTPNSRSVWDAVTTAAGTTVVSATATFTNSDTGRIAMIYGAGAGGGTYYGFVTFVNATTCNLSRATAIARNATTDPNGVKLTVCGDWNRKVTDAAITAGQSVVTSATAVWTAADIGTELVIDGAGSGNQALRSVIKAVNGNTATIVGVASNTVSGSTCAIGVNFGNAVMFHAASGGMNNFVINDASISANRIGSALAIYTDDAQQTTTVSDLVFRNVRITCSDTAGGWEHDLDVDGTWAQNSGGPGIRRVHYENCKFFGARKDGEYIRMAGATHHYFGDGVMVAAPTTGRPGVALLDPASTASVTPRACTDVYFEEFECQGDWYTEGQFTQFMGGRLGSGKAGAFSADLAPVSDNCNVVCVNGGGTNPPRLSGTNGYVQLGNTVWMKRDGLAASFLKWTAAPQLGVTTSPGVTSFMALTGTALTFGSSNNGDVIMMANNLQFLRGKGTQTVLLGKSAPATNSTDGFPYIPANAGPPTGTPTAQAGFVPMYYDTTNHKIWIFDGAWKGVVVA